MAWRFSQRTTIGMIAASVATIGLLVTMHQTQFAEPVWLTFHYEAREIVRDEVVKLRHQDAVFAGDLDKLRHNVNEANALSRSQYRSIIRRLDASDYNSKLNDRRSASYALDAINREIEKLPANASESLRSTLRGQQSKYKNDLQNINDELKLMGARGQNP